MTKVRIPFLSVLLMLGLATAFAQNEVPILHQRVTDFTNTLSYNDWRSLESRLKQFEDSTSTQIAVLLLNSLNGSDIFDYSMKVFDENKIGTKSKNNGVLIVVAKDDHKIRITPGYGLEGVLTDALTTQIIERDIKPYFKANNFYGGLSSGISSIIAATAGEYKVQARGKSAPMITVIMIMIFFGVIGAFVLPFLSGRRRYVIGSGGSRYGSGWGWPYGGSGSGGGFSGGSFGGGGGWSGGGGMSGGGGATGSW
ncbi:MAG: TPM domain-containing protein [Ignavibacteriales bacterium]|nr:TPM domain-containing protein [Ignavibacteriales bacterium]